MAGIRNDTEQVGRLAEEFVERYRRGEHPPVSEYLARYPEHAAEIRDLFPALVLMENVGPSEELDRREAPPSDEPRLKVLGDFRIIREVGRGGMGVVYEAEQVSLGRRVALKVLPRHLLTNEKHAKRFNREARAAARLHHTNIVPVFGVGEQDGVHYYVMQFIRGLGLDEVLVELKRLRDESAVAKVGQPATAQRNVAAQQAVHAHGGAVAQVAHSLLTGQFEKSVLVGGRGAEIGGQTSEVGSRRSAIGGGSGDQSRNEHSDRSPSESPSAAQTGKRAAAETTFAQRADTAFLSGVFAFPGQSETQSKAQSQLVYWQSVARIGIQAADALQYAHDEGIIHRDIKPGNLLLDARGSVWVTDFGLAKAADQQDLTHTGDLVGTLRYMAPEQFDGKADARSDVYALGLTLYELLALQPGFDETDRRKLIKQVTTGEPTRLRSLRAYVPRDLETIVHKAIDRDPAHRYQSAGDIAADLRRYLGDEPIRARWISPLTRFTRWCKRNPAVAGLTSAIAVLITTAAVVAAIAAVRFGKLAKDNGELAVDLQAALGDAEQNLALANAETRRAEAALVQVKDEQQRAEGNLDLALTALDAVYLDAIGTEKLIGNQRTRPQAGAAGFSPSASAPLTDLEKELLKRGLTFYDRFAQQNAGTPRAAVQTAQAHYRVGLLQDALGDNAAAASAYRAAIERFEALIKEEPNNVEYHRRLGESYSGLSRTIADWDTAKPYIEHSIEAYTSAIRLSPDDGDLYTQRAFEHCMVGHSAESNADVLKAAEVSPNRVILQLRAADLLSWSSDPARARPFAERAFKLDPESADGALAMALTFPRNAPEHMKYVVLAVEREPTHAGAWRYLSVMNQSQGDFEQAVQHARKAVELAPNDAGPLTDLGRALVRLNRYEEAERILEQARGIEPHHWYVLAALGELRLGQREYDKAVEALSQAIKLRPGERRWLDPLRHKALASAGRAQEVLAELSTPDSSDFKGQTWHAVLHLAMQDQAGYRSCCRIMVERFANTIDLTAANAVAWACAIGPQAIDDYTPVVALANKVVDAHPDSHMHLNTLGGILFRASRYQEALETLNKGIMAGGRAYVSDAVFLCMIHHRLGNIEQAAKSLEQAKVLRAKNTLYFDLESDFLLREAEAMVLNTAADAVPPTDSEGNEE